MYLFLPIAASRLWHVTGEFADGCHIHQGRHEHHLGGRGEWIYVDLGVVTTVHLGRVVHYTYTSHSSTLTVSFICIYRYPFAKCRNGNARSLLLTVAVTIRRKSRLNGKSPHNYSISSGSVVGLAFRGFSRCVKGDRVQVEAEGLRNRTVFRVNIFQSVTHGYA